MRGKLRCPLCGGPLEFHVVQRIDFVGEGITLFSFKCEKCGYSGFDIFPEKVHEPRVLELRVENERDLNILVARSSTATIRIPEIGAEIKPGPASQGFITTVEGILLRFKEVFAKHKKATDIIDRLLKGEPFTLIIEDPFGTSAIDSTKVKVVVNKQKPFKIP